MGESISTAFLVSLIGMVTVFVILGLVVLTGKTLIKVMNIFFPIEEKELIDSRYSKASNAKAFIRQINFSCYNFGN